jgi:NAD(P)-dependent dehydrogenase (short-subunit alcohol dehydrogenase family)
MSLTQKRVILTGGSGGIGRHVALELVGEGAEVLVLSRRGDVPEGVRHLPVDLATSEGIAAACGHAKREVPDILINMAGVQHFGPAESQSIEEMRASYMIKSDRARGPLWSVLADDAASRRCSARQHRINTGVDRIQSLRDLLERKSRAASFQRGLATGAHRYRR